MIFLFMLLATEVTVWEVARGNKCLIFFFIKFEHFCKKKKSYLKHTSSWTLLTHFLFFPVDAFLFLSAYMFCFYITAFIMYTPNGFLFFHKE